LKLAQRDTLPAMNPGMGMPMMPGDISGR